MTMELVLLVLLIIMAALAVGVGVWIHMGGHKEAERQRQETVRQILEAQKQDQSVQFLQREMINMREQMNKGMTESAKIIADSQKSVGERLDRAANVVGHVQKSLGALDEATKQVFAVGKDISQLQEILRAPKLRGAFGELFLGDLLAQILPPKNFSLQHAFKSGDVVDAVVRIGRLVPVDAKFPLENFKRLIQNQGAQEKTVARRKFITDVKRHIDVIAKKYILPDEGTFDFALMYIPAESVFYEAVIRDDNLADEGSLLTHAFAKRVVPVSPNSFYTYLHTISLGLRGLKIEENAKLILEQLTRLRGDFGRFRDDFALLGKHLSNTRNKYEDAERRLNRFDDKLTVADKIHAEQLIQETTPPVQPVESN